MILGHGGNVYALAKALGCAPGEIMDLSSNINPFGPMPELMAHLHKVLPAVSTLPEADAGSVSLAAAARFRIDPKGVLAGNGTTAFIYALPGILGTRKALIVGPTYADYADACIRHGARVQYLLSRAKASFAPNVKRIQALASRCDTVFICNPNNPTGVLIPKKTLESIVSACPKTRFIIDESYLDFVREGETQSLIPFDAPNRIVLYSFSKMFAIPGLRTGLMVFPPALRKAVFHAQVPWSVNTLAQKALLFLFARPEMCRDFIRMRLEGLEKEKVRFLKAFASVEGIRFFPSRTAFVLGRLKRPYSAADLWRHMAQHRVLIRNCTNFKGLSRQYVRISIRKRVCNQTCAAHMLTYLNLPAAP
ncbi:MAG: pyridoxal phosphate-dependent class II aminotransferase [Deltaproteobacteria bacterium]|nr:pyridoxal phosphate-dependent class II aminotransferase [Deltaproteobacteria bacterium]MBW2133328.1 pyridoxal phosphate-dependent class II aminotransferase [Deltaproteobacteria bacterium]